MKQTNAAMASALALFLSFAQPVFSLPGHEFWDDELQRTAQQKPKVKPGSKG